MNVNNYVPTYPTNKYYLHDTLLRNKYEKIMENKKEYLSQANIINFDIINHRCRNNPQQHSTRHYETIYKEDLLRLKEKDRDDFIGEAIKSKRKDLHVNKDVVNEHFKLTVELIKFKKKNRTLFSSMHGNAQRKKQKEYNII